MKELKINNYKCLEKVIIPDLKRVNLFTGKNNTGKSTILEALSLFAVKGNILWIKQLLDSRGEINNYKDENANIDNNLKILSSFFSNRKIGFDEKDIISINSDTEKFSMRFVKFIEEDNVEKDLDGGEIIIEKRRIISNNAGGDNVSYGLEVKVGANSQILHLDRHMFRRRPFTFEVDNFHLVNSKGDDILNSASLWDKITLSEKEDLVIEALKIIEPNISRLSFVGEEGSQNSRFPIVKLRNTKKIYPLKAMGDGINRILNLTLALVISDNGYLLIDEYENGLHYSVQEKLWEIIFDIAYKLNVQVFATTHSSDSINSFAKVLEKHNEFEGSLFRLDRKNEVVIANPFSKEEITEASRQQINLR
ncbi:MAG: hypothetical protein B6D64_07090 [Bacteroidetes bacterium 4484_276]|nr:MAG: hypothetical protein B6D64_07090 [Bacteroidetes bacterium 4484_276]